MSRWRGLCVGGGTAASLLAQNIVNSLSSKPSKSSGRSLFTYRGDLGSFFTSVAWSPNGKRIASAGRSVQVWDAFNGTHAFTYPDATNRALTLSGSIAWSPDGQFIASSIESHDRSTSTDPLPASINTIQIWKVSNGEHVFTYTGHAGEIGSVAWSPDGKHITFTDRNVQVWNVSNGTLAYAYPEVISSGVGSSVAWSPDGKRLTSIFSDSNTIESWDAFDGSDVIVYSPNDAAGSHVIAWSPDSQCLAYSEAGAVEIWKASTGQRLATYQVHGGALMDYYL